MFGVLLGAGASVAGGLLGGMLGGDQFDPLEYYNTILFGPDGQGGVNAAMHDRINASNKMYHGMIKQANRYGKAESGRIADQGKENLGTAQQSMASRGLYNTGVMDSATTSINESTQRQQTQLGEDLLGVKQGLRMQGANTANSMWDQLWNLQMAPAMSMLNGGADQQNARADAAGGQWGQLFTEIIGGILGG